MKRWSQGAILWVALSLALAACAEIAPSAGMGSSPSIWANDLDHRRATPHVDIFWTCRQSGTALQLEGLVGNPALPGPVYYFEAELVGLDAGEHVVSGGSGGARDEILRPGQSSPFALTVQASGSEARFDLFYDYRYNDSDKLLTTASSARMAWLLAAQEHRYRVVDACNPAKHRAR